MDTLGASSLKQLTSLLFLFTAGIGTLFLFYIDEGNYNLDNLFTTGNLIALSFYFLGIYCSQLALFYFLSRKKSLFSSSLLSITIGFPLGTALTICFIFFIGWIMHL